jgi:hypothetical protein
MTREQAEAKAREILGKISAWTPMQAHVDFIANDLLDAVATERERCVGIAHEAERQCFGEAQLVAQSIKARILRGEER